MVLVDNRRVVIPFLKDIYKEVAINNISIVSRGENRYVQIFNDAISQIALPFKILCEDWVEVYVDGKRLLNPRLYSNLGGTEYEKFNIVGQTLIFKESIFGEIAVISDTNVPTAEEEKAGVLIEIENAQGYKSKTISLYHEPVVMTPPEFGYARLSFDRKSILYVPYPGFSGMDQFNYCIINNHGQQSRNRCIRIKVG
jgi:hypothetical protein